MLPAVVRLARCAGLLLLAASVVAAKQDEPKVHRHGPRMVSSEDILEMADNWLYHFDDNEDEAIDIKEMPALLASLREASSMPEASGSMLTPELFMSQADDGDGLVKRPELIDMLKRMKGFDAGHIDRAAANKPRPVSAEDQSYGKPHSERMKAKKGGKKKQKKKAKDEV